MKRWTIRRDRGVRPRLITMHVQWLFRHVAHPARLRHCKGRPEALDAGWKTLTALQSRGRL
ncbi:hypothetical protein RHEC894_CH02542 [Rhizobium sp. CIAT894]|nr:hypothetical protein RHEC894_CH02542 [Rhizobium sp. CIAT894]